MKFVYMNEVYYRLGKGAVKEEEDEDEDEEEEKEDEDEDDEEEENEEEDDEEEENEEEDEEEDEEEEKEEEDFERSFQWTSFQWINEVKQRLPDVDWWQSGWMIIWTIACCWLYPAPLRLGEDNARRWVACHRMKCKIQRH
ncbi:hypothetical protein M8J77_016427 [Diaphorina citri]|nr:hypothetical protein M8J77_016427 [Diaphorina citri]